MFSLFGVKIQVVANCECQLLDFTSFNGLNFQYIKYMIYIFIFYFVCDFRRSRKRALKKGEKLE